MLDRLLVTTMGIFFSGDVILLLYQVTPEFLYELLLNDHSHLLQQMLPVISLQVIHEIMIG